MQEHEVIKILQEDLKFTDQSIDKLKMLETELLKVNQKHNFISKSTENLIWSRHILDSAQLVRYISFKEGSLSDLGSGAGFPGLVIAIFNQNFNFHVKLYEKSPVKRDFLNDMIGMLKLKATLFSNVFDGKIESDYIVSRAFKKLDKIIQVSREIAKKPHKLIILKGQNAQEEAIKAFKNYKYTYKLENSMSDEKSKIILADIF
ncbi:16S rRNA (guanine(527)-N(7))-methyltransferase RsmG [Candidatus Pelagibacter bacterium]|nr:16S rRNA (guanine(527)-N(7))-methyltransferase RsmG [Candidatus Pelagibacter bacterium]MDA9619107.1 16S rRNA (guanine(527)-N(7))-methyltransferase RsmG [Candidatus Pelagibacter bacterium]